MRMLLIEDDPVSASIVVKTLSIEGHFCDVVTSAQDYRNDMVFSNGNHQYDMVILDIHLPGDTDGYDILLRLRNAKINVPIFIISCISASGQKAKGLNFGADDYLVKPFDRCELLARINAIIRRTTGHPESIVRTGNIIVNFDHRTVEVDQGNDKFKVIQLTNKEYAMIELLALRKGTVLTKEVFLNHLYNGLDEPSDSKIVDVFMCKLRKKLMNANNNKSHIETVWGRGYVLKDSAEEDTGYQIEKEYQNKENAYQKDAREAVRNVSFREFKQALEMMADINAMDYDGNTLLMDIISGMVINNSIEEEQYYNMIDLLLKDKRLNINIRNKKDGNTALHAAAVLLNKKLIEKLLENKNIDFSILNNQGKTAEEFARDNRAEHIAAIIENFSKREKELNNQYEDDGETDYNNTILKNNKDKVKAPGA